jgi:outer membrane protein TolC
MDGLPTVGAWGEAGTIVGVGPTVEAGVLATVPLFEGGGRVSEVRARRAVEEGEAVALAEAERSVEADVRLALRTARYAAAALSVSKEAVALAGEELERAEARYRAGEGDNLAVVAAQANLAESRLAAVDALAAFNLAVVGWYAARGEARGLAE